MPTGLWQAVHHGGTERPAVVNEYPAHPFVIDKNEATTLFYNVVDFDQTEQLISQMVEDERPVLRYPRRTTVVWDLSEEYRVNKAGGERDDDSTGRKKAIGKGRARGSPKPEESGGEHTFTATAKNGRVTEGAS